MYFDDSLGIIELDNANLRCLIFKINNNNENEILSTATTPSEGIHNDAVLNLSKASKAIRKCISSAESKAKISLKKINVVFEQSDFLCTKFSKHRKIDGAKIYKEDIEFLLKEAKRQLTLNDENQSIIHIFNHNYMVDGKNFVEEPIGVYANTLTHEITFVTTPKNNLKNINQAFIDCDIEVERLISRTFALGAELFNNEDLQYGSVLVNLGLENISLGLFKNLALVHSVTFPFGACHITKDISKVCSLSQAESENITKNIDFSFPNNDNIFDENNYLKNSYFINSNFRKISKKLITEVIKARLDEIIEKLKKQIVVSGFNLNYGVKLLIVGEGSSFTNIEKYFFNFFDQNLKKIDSDINKTSGLEKNFTSCLGALKIIKDGWETEAIPKKSDKNIEKIGFFAKIFGIHK